MKKIIYKKNLIYKAIIFVAIITALSGCSTDSSEKINALAIRDIQSDPLSFTGEITITGVVATFSAVDKTLFGVVDTAELLNCKNLNCGAFILPAKYIGDQPFPEIADEVNITGSWSESEIGTIFEVTKFDVKRNIMNLLSE